MREVKHFSLVAFVLLLAILSGAPYLWGLEKDTHAFLNNEIVQSYSILPDVLDKQLGFKQGIMEILAEKTVLQWFEDAGRYEDEPPLSRYFNHFHDPLQPWYLAGFDKTFKSSLIWAQDQGMIGSLFGGDWSWKKARQSFHKGLTSITKTEREKNLADTFRALGQIMHLIHDASVPAHVRNDPHVYLDLFGKKIGKYHYEVWVNENIQRIVQSLSPINFDKAIFNIIPEGTAPIPIANIFDTNKYTVDGSNPEVTTEAGIGITEYTNANFFSGGTIFKNYPHPTYADTNLLSIDWKNPEIVDAEDGKLDSRIYIKKTAGQQVQRLASLGYIAYNCIKKGYYEFSPLVLDNKVYEEYASKLIPRAVGYSAGLLEYFFRGKLQVTAVPVFNKNRITYLRTKMKNLTPDETMSYGTFTLTYSYTSGTDVIWAQAPVVSSGTLVYNGEETIIDFVLPTPIPKGSYDSAKFTLAFLGTLGNEVGAVIGKALTLGEIKFEEEWDNGLTGNYTWAHTEVNYYANYNPPDNGISSSVIDGDYLVKENIRFAGYRTSRFNDSFVGHDDLGGSDQFIDILPIRITRDTYVQFKIDEMWINERTPALPGYTNDYQNLVLVFNNNLKIQYSTAGQAVYLGPAVASYDFDPNLTIVDNIYKLFENAGITVPDGDLYLRTIGFCQHMWSTDSDSVIEYRQRMKIDSIRILEGRQQ